MATFKKIAIANIVPNEARNFKLYPMDKVQVDSLIDSFADVGDFGTIPVRPIGGGMYEQACGHHRLEALKQMDETHIQCLVEDYDDDDMVHIMILENARQKGDNAPAALDSLSAVIYKVAYYILISDSADDFCELVGAPTGSAPRNYNGSREAIAAGESVPFSLLKMYAGGGIAGNSQVKELNATLRASGELGRIYKAVQKRVNEEMAEQEEAERLAEEARQKAMAKAERERKAAEKAAEEARKAAEKAKASQKKAAEARAAQAKRDAEKKAKARREEMQRQAEARELADKKRAERNRLAEEAKAAAAAAKAAAKGLNPEVLRMLKSQRHQEVFRKYVTSEKGKQVFPEARQPEIVRAMLKHMEDNGLELTSATMQDYLGDLIVKANKELARLIKEAEERQEKASVRKKVDNRIDDFKRSVMGTSVALRKVVEVLDDDKTGEYAFYQIATDTTMTRNIESLENMLANIRRSLKLRETHVNKNRPINDDIVATA